MSDPVVKYVDFGVAWRVEDIIYINKDMRLPEFQELHDAVLKHELGHEHSLGLWHDLKDIFRLEKYGLSYFVIGRPSTYWQFLPVTYDPESNTVGLMVWNFLITVAITFIFTFVIWKLVRYGMGL